MDCFCHLLSVVKDVVSTVLKIAAVSCQSLNVDPIGQGGKFVFQKSQGKNIRFHEKSHRKCMLCACMSGKFQFQCQNVCINPG